MIYVFLWHHPQATKTLAQKRLALQDHASDMGEAPLHLGQLFSSREGSTHKVSLSADFLMESFHLRQNYDVLMNTTSNLKVVS